MPQPLDQSIDADARAHWWHLYRANPALRRRFSFPQVLALRDLALATALFPPDPPAWAPTAGPLPLLARQRAVRDRLWGDTLPPSLPAPDPHPARQPRPAAEIAAVLARTYPRRQSVYAIRPTGPHSIIEVQGRLIEPLTHRTARPRACA